MDEIERRVRAARPPSGHRDLPLTDRAKRELAELALVDETTPARSGALRGVPARVATSAAVIAAALLLVPLGTTLTPAPAAALTPPPLEWTPTTVTVSDAVDDALRSLERSDGLDEPQRESHSIGWYFHVDVEGERASRTVISPEEVHFTWDEDLSARIRVVAGTPYWADDPARALPPDAPRAGEVLRDEVFAPGEYDPLLPDPPGRTPAELEEFLQPIALGGLSSGFALFDAIDTAFQAWSLTNEQQGSLLELIDDASGVTVLGAGLDRAGRPVIGLSTTHPDVAQERHILVSQETGRIIGFEIYMVEGDDYFPGNAVISYTLYEGENP